jgi:hypothetical protein
MVAPDARLYPSRGHLFGVDVSCSGVASRKTPDLGLPDWTIVTSGVVLSLWGIVLEQSLARGGSKVERCVPYHIDYSGSWRRGAAEA